ncbi:ATP-dependent DNA helicase pif1-like [Oscarella lobularis]|uniref:ATP-dependent DNA helicase pif1-like n=1 Tax=Oscarella lobularis TaxID=121494 RepID=UPI0033144A0F
MEDIESIVNIQMPFEETEEDPNEAQKDEEKDLGQQKIRDQDDWMKLCRPPNSANNFDEDDTRDSEFNQGDLAHYNWSEKLAQFPPLSEAPKFVTEARKKSTLSKKDLVAAADSSLLQGNQKLAYDIVRSHNELTKSGFECKPLRMIVCGSAGTGKSYLINCIKEMLGSECILAAPTGVAAFNIGGQTLHSLLRIPLQKTSFSDVQGPSLRDLQERFEDVRYLIIDKMSMVGRHQLSLIHRRLCQALPQGACESFGGISVIFFGDMGQLPPVGDSPLYRSAATEGSATNQGRQLYMTFDVVVQLTKIIRQSGNDELQIKFRDALQRLRDGCPSYEDWNDLYMSRNFARHDQLGDVKTSFRDAVRLFACRENVAEFNFNCLKNSNKPVAVINADHNCTEAKNDNEEDAGGLYARVRLCEGARVMLTSNLWTEMGLINGSMGYVVAILYQPGAKPPALPTAVVVQMDKYDGPTWGGERCVPICPIERTWPSSTGNRKSSCKRRQLPIQLAWAVTVHKSQGLTLDRAVIDIGKREFAPGITYVGFSRVRHINHCLIQGFDYARISNLSKSKSYKQRLNEDKRLDGLARRTEKTFQSLAGNSNDTVPDDIKEFFKHLENEESVIDKEEHSDHTYSKKMIADNDKDTDKIDTGAVKVTKTAAKKAPVPKPKGKRASRARTSVPLPPAAKKRRTNTPPSPNPFLLQMGRKRESIVGDGKCYFRTVSKAAFGTEDHHLALRLQIVNFMAEYKSVFEMFCCNTEYEAHISKLRQEGAWATQAEIHATATLFQIDVSIFTWMGKEWTWNTYKQRFDITVPALIRLPVNRIEIQHYRNHFDLIVPIDQSELALASPRKSAKACDNPKLLCSSLAANEADLLMANEQ